MRSPAFQFYSSNWLGSRAVRLMDAEQRGWYIQLLAESWENEPQASLPNDDPLLRTLAAVNPASVNVDERWTFVKSQFKVKGKLLLNVRLSFEHAKQEDYRRKRQAAGTASGAVRRSHQKPLKRQQLDPEQNRTSVQLCSPDVRTNDEQTLNKQGTKSNSLTPTLIPTPTQDLDPVLEKKGSSGKGGTGEKPKPRNKDPRPRRRSESGTRIREDFTVSPEVADWAAEKAPDVELQAALEEFVDFWMGMPGVRGRKLDWDRTFKVQLRKLQHQARREKEYAANRRLNFQSAGEKRADDFAGLVNVVADLHRESVEDSVALVRGQSDSSERR